MSKILIVGTAYPYRGGIAAFNERLAAPVSQFPLPWQDAIFHRSGSRVFEYQEGRQLCESLQLAEGGEKNQPRAL